MLWLESPEFSASGGGRRNADWTLRANPKNRQRPTGSRGLTPLLTLYLFLCRGKMSGRAGHLVATFRLPLALVEVDVDDRPVRRPPPRSHIMNRGRQAPRGAAQRPLPARRAPPAMRRSTACGRAFWPSWTTRAPPISPLSRPRCGRSCGLWASSKPTWRAALRRLRWSVLGARRTDRDRGQAGAPRRSHGGGVARPLPRPRRGANDGDDPQVALGHVLMRDGHGPRTLDILACRRGSILAKLFGSLAALEGRRPGTRAPPPRRRVLETAGRQNQTNSRRAATTKSCSASNAQIGA
jgi:hypothetical protein